MKIIHVPDKSDYKSLMERLARDGYSWLGGEEIKWSNYSALHDKSLCVLIEEDKTVAVNSKGSFGRLIPEIEIEMYREGFMDVSADSMNTTEDRTNPGNARRLVKIE